MTGKWPLQNVLVTAKSKACNLMHLQEISRNVFGKWGHQNYATKYIKWLSSVFVFMLLKSLGKKKTAGILQQNNVFFNIFSGRKTARFCTLQ